MNFPSSHPFVSFTPTMEDFASAQRLCVRRIWLGSLRLWSVIALVLGLGMLAATLIGPSDAWIYFGIGGTIGYAGLAFFQYFVWLPRRARRIYAQQKTLQLPIGVSWSDESYFVSSQVAHSALSWTDYESWRMDKTVILFMQSERLFQFLPRRALTAEQFDGILAAIKGSGLKES